VQNFKKIYADAGIFLLLLSVLHLYYYFVLAVPFVLNVQHTQLKHPCPRRDSNTQSQQASDCRPTPYTARPLGWAGFEPIYLNCEEDWYRALTYLSLIQLKVNTGNDLHRSEYQTLAGASERQT
jgi:hypothetical protein